MADRIHVWRGELDSTAAAAGPGPWDIVVANILAPIIIRLLSEDGLLGYVAPDGYLILSGIIDEQGPDVEAALSAAGGDVYKRQSQGCRWHLPHSHPATCSLSRSACAKSSPLGDLGKADL